MFKEKTDLELIIIVKEKKEPDTSDAYSELKERHGGIYMNTIQQKLLKNFPQVYAEMVELFDKHFDSFVKSYDGIRTGRGGRIAKFSTFVCNRTGFICLNSIKKFIKRKEIYSSVDNFTALCENTFRPEDLPREYNQFDFLLEKAKEGILQLKDKRGADIIQRRFLNEEKESLKSIAKSYNLSGQQVLNIQNACLDDLKNYIKKQTKI